MKEAVKKKNATCAAFDEAAWDAFDIAACFTSAAFSRTTRASSGSGAERIEQVATPTSRSVKDVIFYMATPPQVVPQALEKMKAHNLSKGTEETRLVV